MNLLWVPGNCQRLFSISPSRLNGPLFYPVSLFSYLAFYPRTSSISDPSHLQLTSGKSTQKAFIFSPYKNPAKFSLNLAKLSCINCRCMKFASKSAMLSLSSANAGSKSSSGWLAPTRPEFECEERREEREVGRKGVVGREREPVGVWWRVRERERGVEERGTWVVDMALMCWCVLTESVSCCGRGG